MLQESDMGTLVCLICIAVAVLAQLAVAQGANNNLPLTYPGQVSPAHTGCVGENPRMLAVMGSLTSLVVCSITRCVGGSLATSWEIQTLSLVLVGRLTPTTLKESV